MSKWRQPHLDRIEDARACNRVYASHFAQTYIVLLIMQMMSWVTTLALQILLPMTVVGCAICKS